MDLVDLAIDSMDLAIDSMAIDSELEHNVKMVMFHRTHLKITTNQ